MKTLIRFMSIAFAMMCVLSSCSSEKIVETGNCNYAKIADYSECGRIHNDFLSYVKESVQSSENKEMSTSEAIEYLNRLACDYFIYSESFYKDDFELKRNCLTNSINQITNLVQKKSSEHNDGLRKAYPTPYYTDEQIEMMLSDSVTYSILEEIGYERIMEYGASHNIITVDAKRYIDDLFDILNRGAEGLLTDEQIEACINKLIEDIDNRNYDTDDNTMFVVGPVISIGKNSYEWWEENQDILPTETKVAPWVAAAAIRDIKGAVYAVIGQATYDAYNGSNSSVRSYVQNAIISGALNSASPIMDIVTSSVFRSFWNVLWVM